MKKCYCIFDQHIKGIVSLVVVCILPFISPLISFLNGSYSFLPYVMILVANVGVLYEFVPFNREQSVKRIKIERLIVELSSAIFSSLTIFCLFYIGEVGEKPFILRMNYALLLYVLVPFVVTFIELIYSFCIDFKDNDEYDGNVISEGIASEV